MIPIALTFEFVREVLKVVLRAVFSREGLTLFLVIDGIVSTGLMMVSDESPALKGAFYVSMIPITIWAVCVVAFGIYIVAKIIYEEAMDGVYRKRYIKFKAEKEKRVKSAKASIEAVVVQPGFAKVIDLVESKE